jgi:hypothetical protein
MFISEILAKKKKGLLSETQANELIEIEMKRRVQHKWDDITMPEKIHYEKYGLGGDNFQYEAIEKLEIEHPRGSGRRIVVAEGPRGIMLSIKKRLRWVLEKEGPAAYEREVRKYRNDYLKTTYRGA